MPFVRRNVLGSIESLHRHQETGASEFLSDQNTEVRAFLGLHADGADEFGKLDAGFVRVIEDLIDVLIAKNVITITDLPIEAQNKLFARKSFRDSAGKRSLRLFADSSPGEDIVHTDFSDFG